jgi:hypothetical protein
MDSNFDHQMSLSKNNSWYSNNCLKCAVPLNGRVMLFLPHLSSIQNMAINSAAYSTTITTIELKGATTLSITIKNATLSIMTSMLMQSVNILSVTIKSIMLSVVLLNVVAPIELDKIIKIGVKIQKKSKIDFFKIFSNTFMLAI